MSSALSTKLIDGHAALEVAATLIAHGAEESHVKRIAQLVLPDGLEAIASHAARLQEQANKFGIGDLSLQVTSTVGVLGERSYTPAATLSKELQDVQRERLLWASVLKDTLPHVASKDEERVVTRDFVARHINLIYFLVGSNPDLFQSSSRLLKLVGALNCVVGDWGQKVEAIDYLELQFQSLDLSSRSDIRYALALVNVMREYGQGSDAQFRRIAPGISRQLAKLLVDNSFFHRVSWIEQDASSEQRERWFEEEVAAGTHSSMQLAAGEVLLLLGKRVENAEGILVSFIDEFINKLEELETDEEITLLSSRYGSYSIRAAVKSLLALNSITANSTIQKLKQVDRRKLGAFEGVFMELSQQ